MLFVEIDEKKNVVILEPDGALSQHDFESAAKLIDPYIEADHPLRGLLIHAKYFPGWDSFAALCAHLKFVRNHHKKIARVAFATDSVVAELAETVASHFVSAELKLFSYNELDSAKRWVAGAGKPQIEKTGEPNMPGNKA